MRLADSLALALSLAIVNGFPYWFGALALTWLTHEVYLHRNTGVLGQLIHRKTPWSPHLLGHGTAFLPSFILLFFGYLSLLAFVVLLLMILAGGGLSPWTFSFVAPFLGVGLILSMGGFLVLRRDKRRLVSVGGV